MQSLTPETFEEAMTLCGENSHYKACVVFADRKAMIEFIAKLKEIGNIPNVRRAVTRRTDYGRLEFFNGSVLEILPATEANIRGKKCNQLIVTGGFDHEAQSRLTMMTVPYRSAEYGAESIFDAALFGLRSRQQTAWDISDEAPQIEIDTEPSEALDAFLDSFSVNKSVNKTAL